MRMATVRDRWRIAAALAAVVLAWIPNGAARAESSVVDLPLGGGAVERVLYMGPVNPAAVLVMFPGGDGIVRLGQDGTIGVRGNFLVRTRQQWVDSGFAVAIPDVPSNLPDLKNGRLSPAYADAIGKIVAFVHGRSGAPVWLVGTSRGTVAAANGASRLTAHQIAGLVLTSTVTKPGGDGHETVFGANLAAIDVPVLILSHEGDKCRLTSPAARPQIKAALTAAPKVEIATLTGGLPPKSGPCEAMSEHGFYGIEPQAVGEIAAWIKSH